MSKLEAELRAAIAHVTKGPWIKSGVRTTFREEEKATWIGPDGYSIIAVMFSDRTPDDYRASMADAKWVFLAQPANIATLLNTIATLRSDNERLGRERDEARELVTEANNSLYGSHGYFHSLNGGDFDKYHLATGIENLKSSARSDWRRAAAALTKEVK